MRFHLVVLVLVTFACGLALAQGYDAYNGRNHPELDWQVAETERFEIMYPAHLSGIEEEAAPILETSLDSLLALFSPRSEEDGTPEVTFPEKIRVYLADMDEIANGFAIEGGRVGHTLIWVNVNNYASIWTGDVKWLRKVLAHELAHIVHYRAVRSNVGLWQNLLASAYPSTWTEGFAQYATERWDAARGDRYLRQAVFEDRLSTSDDAPDNGRLRYAIGNSQVRYLAQTYGDSTITNILAHRSPALLGLARVHDFRKAFKEKMDMPYNDFVEEWRKHINVYYNTMAGQMERLDSLGIAPITMPGQSKSDIRFSPDTTRIAAVVLTSTERPVTRLFTMNNVTADSTLERDVDVLAEGAIQSPFAWSPDGEHIAYARLHRSDHGSLLNDLYIVHTETGHTRRLTDGRRATSPTFSPDGQRLAFVGVEGSTANVFSLDLDTGEESQITHYEGDVQITSVQWSPTDDRIALALFDADRRRRIVVEDVETGEAIDIGTDESVPEHLRDDRNPVWSPDGERIAFTSLRDGTPNIFLRRVKLDNPRDHAPTPGDTEERITFLYAGAKSHDWLPADSLHPAGRLVVTATETKRRDRAFVIDAERRPTVTTDSLHVPAAYAEWTRHAPPAPIPDAIRPDSGASSTILSRRAYNSLANFRHAITLPLPYGDPGEDGEMFTGDDDWGAFASTLWLEPLGKHSLFALGGISATRFVDRSFLWLSYQNRTLEPTLTLNTYRFPSPSSFYGNRLLIENMTGGDVSAEWPLDLIDKPFRTTIAGARLRLAHVEPFSLDAFEDTEVAGGTLFTPEDGLRADVQLGFAYKFQRPYAHNVVYPLDGTGIRARLTIGLPFNASNRYLRPDLQAYHVTAPVLGIGRFYLMGRATARFGDQLAQDYVGLSRYDDIDFQVPVYGAVTLDDAERVRGYRSYAVGNRVLFGTVEYRIEPLIDLHTTLLGGIKLGRVSPTLFTDAGMVWTGGDLDNSIRRLGVGFELKNAVSIGPFKFLHSLGIAVPTSRLDEVWDGSIPWDDVDLYYRVQGAVPF